MLQPETARWLNESRGSFGAAHRRFNDISSMDVTGAAALFMSAEYAVKAVIAEHYGFLPPRDDCRSRRFTLVWRCRRFRGRRHLTGELTVAVLFAAPRDQLPTESQRRRRQRP